MGRMVHPPRLPDRGPASIAEDWVHPNLHDAFIYQMSTGKWVPVSNGSQTTHLWVGPEPK